MFHLTNNNPKSIDLEINEYLQEWIFEEWNFDVKPTVQNLKSIGDFTAFAKESYSRINKVIKNMSIFQNN